MIICAICGFMHLDPSFAFIFHKSWLYLRMEEGEVMAIVVVGITGYVEQTMMELWSLVVMLE